MASDGIGYFGVWAGIDYITSGGFIWVPGEISAKVNSPLVISIMMVTIMQNIRVLFEYMCKLH